MISQERMSFKKIRLDRMAARRAFYAFLLVIAALALYRTVYPPQAVIVERPMAGAPDLPAQLFAQDFAAAYLSYDAEQPDRRIRALEAFSEDNLWGYTPPAAGSRVVTRTAVEQVYPKPDDQALYVIAANTSTGLAHLSVTVGRDENGALRIVGLPALVGSAARAMATEAPRSSSSDVDDAALKTVVERAMRNWLAHSTADLEADLSPDAQIALTDETYELDHLISLEDLNDGSVRSTVVVVARSGEQLTLAYDVNVEKRADRWTVSAIQVLPDWH